VAQFPAFPLWTDAYLGDTTHLTTIEHGAYLLLLIVAWRSKDGALPDDDIMLARYSKLRLNHWKRMRPIIEPFFLVQDSTWVQLRLKDELTAVKLLSQNQSRKAKARWLKTKDSAHATASAGHSRGDASPTPTPTPTPKRKKPLVKKKQVTLEELSVNHVQEWLAKKRIEGKYLHHDEQAIIETFKNYCESKTKEGGKPRYENFIAAYKNAFDWDRCQPKTQGGGKLSKHQRARIALGLDKPEREPQVPIDVTPANML